MNFDVLERKNEFHGNHARYRLYRIAYTISTVPNKGFEIIINLCK